MIDNQKNTFTDSAWFGKMKSLKKGIIDLR